MISIHAHAYGADGLGVLELPQAATIVNCDSLSVSPGARSRQRRAVAELAAYGRLQGFLPEMQIFGANLDTIRTDVQALYPTTLGYQYLLANPAVLELVVSNLIADNPSLAGLPSSPTADCGSSWKQEEPFAVWNEGPTVMVSGEVSVTDPQSAVESVMDAQRWDDCSPFWDPPPTATEIVRVQTGNTYVPMTSPPPPGSDYGWNALFEHFVCAVSGCSVWFDNLLQVKNYHTKLLPKHPLFPGYVVSYWLPPGAGLAGCVDGTGPNCTGGTSLTAVTDQGWLEVYTDKMRTMVYTNKAINLGNSVANGMLQALLGAVEVDKELAEQACCLRMAP